MVMIEYKWDKAMLDTDFAIKMNHLNEIDAIVEYLSALVGKIYIHEYVYENEILTPRRIKEQIDHLVTEHKAEIVGIDYFNDDYSKLVYEDTKTLLKNADPNTIVEGKNWGEILSVAFAKATAMRYILSDERNLQEFLDIQWYYVDLHGKT